MVRSSVQDKLVHGLLGQTPAPMIQNRILWVRTVAVHKAQSQINQLYEALSTWRLGERSCLAKNTMIWSYHSFREFELANSILWKYVLNLILNYLIPGRRNLQIGKRLVAVFTLTKGRPSWERFNVSLKVPIEVQTLEQSRFGLWWYLRFQKTNSSIGITKVDRDSCYVLFLICIWKFLNWLLGVGWGEHHKNTCLQC